MTAYYFDGLLSGLHWLTDVRLDVEGSAITKLKAGEKRPEAALNCGYALPGMANCHSHVFQRAAAGLAEYRTADRDDFWSWRRAMYRFAAHMTPVKLRTIATSAYLDMVANGYTSVGEFHYLHNTHLDQSLAMANALIEAADIAGIALTLLPVFYEASDFGGAEPLADQAPFVMQVDDFCRFLRVIAPKLKGNNRLGVAFHSLRAVKPESFAPILAAMDKIDDSAPIHIHIAEQEREVEASLAYSGMRPVEWLLTNQPVDERWCLIHATHVSDSEVKAIAKSGAVVGLCPTTEANLGDGIFPVRAFMQAGGRIAIGSDSNICLDPREELRLVEYVQRLVFKERLVLAASEGGHVGERLWAEAASGGAQALGQNVGLLEAGKRADILWLWPDHHMMAAPSYGQILDAFVFVADADTLNDVMVGGKIIMDDGFIEEDYIHHEAYAAVVGPIAEAVEGEL